MRTGGLPGIHLGHQALDVFLGDDGAALVANEMRARFVDDLAQARAYNRRHEHGRQKYLPLFQRALAGPKGNNDGEVT